jgi:hypothetical protein
MTDEERVYPIAPIERELAASMHFEEQAEVPHLRTDLKRDIAEVLNRHSAENLSGTPDFILSVFLQSCLNSFNQAVRARADWRGESVELPALQKLNDGEKEVPLVVYTNNQRNEIGTARIKVTPGEMYVAGQIGGVLAMVLDDTKSDKPLQEPTDDPFPPDKRETYHDSRFERYQREGFNSH